MFCVGDVTVTSLSERADDWSLLRKYLLLFAEAKLVLIDERWLTILDLVA